MSLGAGGAGSWLLCWSQVQSRCILGRKCSLEMRSCWQLDEHRVTVPVIRAPRARCLAAICKLPVVAQLAGHRKGSPGSQDTGVSPSFSWKPLSSPSERGLCCSGWGRAKSPPPRGLTRHGLRAERGFCLGQSSATAPRGGRAPGLAPIPLAAAGFLAVPAREGRGAVCPAVQEEGEVCTGVRGQRGGPAVFPAVPLAPRVTLPQFPHPAACWVGWDGGGTGQEKPGASPQPMDKTLHPHPSSSMRAAAQHNDFIPTSPISPHNHIFMPRGLLLPMLVHGETQRGRAHGGASRVTGGLGGPSVAETDGSAPGVSPSPHFCALPPLPSLPGGRCWRYQGSTLLPGFPQKCSARGLPRHPDTALYFQRLRRLVLFKGAKYFVASEESLSLEPYYPRSLRDWDGVPPGTTGALARRDGSVYFFRDERYWRFDQAKLRVVATGKWATQLPWMGCWDANGGQALF